MGHISTSMTSVMAFESMEFQYKQQSYNLHALLKYIYKTNQRDIYYLVLKILDVVFFIKFYICLLFSLLLPGWTKAQKPIYSQNIDCRVIKIRGFSKLLTQKNLLTEK